MTKLIAKHQQKNNKEQGGKMTTIEFLKNGSGIHIKKKNRGKFTSYCGGKVTDSCIQRAKASGNPTLVKRATFAQNARKWKHSEGGNLHKWSSNFGRTVDSNPNLDNMKGDYVSKKKSKYQDGGNIVDNFRKNYPTASKVAQFIPFIGTALDGYDIFAKGDYSKTPEFLIGLAGDLTGYGAISKALKARKAYKALLTTRLINPSSVSMPVLKQAMQGTNKATTRAINATTTDVLGHAFNFKNGGRI